MKDNVKRPQLKLTGLAPVPDFNWGSWMGWAKDDPAWRWFTAVSDADAFANTEALIELIFEHVPEKAQPFVADFLDRRLKLDKQQPKKPRWLWLPPKAVIAMAGRYVDSLRQKGLPLGEAVDAVFKHPGMIWSEFFTRQMLYDHCAGNTGFGYEEIKRFRKFHPDRISSRKKKKRQA